MRKIALFFRGKFKRSLNWGNGFVTAYGKDYSEGCPGPAYGEPAHSLFPAKN
jgi:hypothetical protein